MTSKIITLTTDFGLRDPYVAEMKAAILSICPKAIIVDITHQVEKFNINNGAFLLASISSYFPKGTIHVAVVDPGVGTQRRPIIIRCKDAFFVGPDNGLLNLAAENKGILDMREISASQFMMTRISATFHGRDVFSPVAAHLANGVPFEEFGPRIAEIVKPTFKIFTQIDDSFAGEVIHIDEFGNIVTNIEAAAFMRLKISVAQVKFPTVTIKSKVLKSYGAAKVHEAVVLIGSQEYLEIALNQGNAAQKFNVRTGDKVVVSKIL